MRGVSRLLPFLRRRRRALIRDDATLFRRARLQLTAWYALTPAGNQIPTQPTTSGGGYGY